MIFNPCTLNVDNYLDDHIPRAKVCSRSLGVWVDNFSCLCIRYTRLAGPRTELSTNLAVRTGRAAAAAARERSLGAGVLSILP